MNAVANAKVINPLGLDEHKPEISTQAPQGSSVAKSFTQITSRV